MMRLATLVFLLAAGPARAAYDANGIALGASEKAVVGQFPAVHCKPLQWSSSAAERRCDDAKVVFGGIGARITFYLKADKVQAFDVRFESKDTERAAAFLKSRYGAPAAETREAPTELRKSELYKLLWKNGDEHAVFTSQRDRRRASLTVSRGNFEDEIYRVR
jgi:hypothetical protein